MRGQENVAGLWEERELEPRSPRLLAEIVVAENEIGPAFAIP